MTFIGKDILLPLPASIVFLKGLLVFSFLLHIVFVNFMLGGTFFGILYRILGRIKKDDFYTRFAREIVMTTTVTKSMAVVLGVAPLLSISLAYTKFFYVANGVTAPYWLSVPWLVITAFLLLYLYKFTWDTPDMRFWIHLSAGIATCLIFFFIPFIFLTNINLMLYPDTWDKVRGFWSSVILPNVIPRYLHFMTASFAVAGFFSFFLFRRRLRTRPSSDANFYLRSSKLGILWALAATLTQAIFGLINFWTLPDVAYSWHVTLLVLIALAIAGLVSFFLFQEYNSKNTVYGLPILLLISALIITMGLLRHIIRENALKLPRQVLAENTEYYRMELTRFKEEAQAEAKPVTGKDLFMTNCSPCHAFDKKVIGPPLSYAVEKYKDNKEAMAEFVEDPKKVNPEYPEMPKLGLSEEDIRKIIDYIYNP